MIVSFSLSSGDLLGSSLTFTPSSATISAAPADIAGGLGDIVAAVSTTTTLGFLNGPCGSTLSPGFTLMNATVDNSAGNLVDPLPQASAGPEGTLEPLRNDTGGGSPANGLPAYVDRYPSFLNTLLVPESIEGTGAPVVPLARYAGSTLVNGQAVVAQLLIFAPAALNAFGPPDPLNDAAGLGYVAMTVVNDPTQPRSPGQITGLCTSFSLIANIYGVTKANPCAGNTAPPCSTDAGISGPPAGAPTGRVRYANPATPNTYLYGGLSTSARDVDGDGIENSLDTCPYTATTGYNPRAIDLANDPDLDMLPGGGPAGGCDPTPNTDTGSGNHDGDAAPNATSWQNSADNCPLTVNGTNADSENTLSYNVAAYRGGPDTDHIGDACDSNPNKADGTFFTRLKLEPKCIGGTDADGDGWCAATSPSSLNDPNDSNANRTPEDYDLILILDIAHSGSGVSPPAREPLQVCDDGIDNDGDGLVDILDSAAGPSTCRPKGLAAHPGYPTCPSLGCIGIDTDGDGWTDQVEMWVGTDALGRCEVGPVPSRSTDWPPDLVSGGIPDSTDRITVSDLTALLALSGVSGPARDRKTLTGAMTSSPVPDSSRVGSTSMKLQP